MAICHHKRAAVALAVAAGLAVAAAPLWLAGAGETAFLLARVLACVALVAVWAGLGAGDGRPGGLPAIAAPALLLPAAAFALYSAGPFLYLALAGESPRPLPAGMTPFQIRVDRVVSDGMGHLLPGYLSYAVGSPAEALVLAAVGWLAAAAALADAVLPARQTPPRPFPAAWGLGLAVGGGAAFHLLRPVVSSGGMAASLVDVLPAVAALGVAILVHRAVLTRSLLPAVAGLVASAVLMAPYQIKTMTFLAGFSLLILFVVSSLRVKLATLVLAVALPLVASMAIQVNRNQVETFRLAWSIGESVRWKLVLRQAESVFCLNFAMAEQRHADGPGYFLLGLVPRALWSDKPSLSSGAQVGRDYCGVSVPPDHSGSITLVGEPLARAGLAGLAAAAVFLAGMLVANLAAWKRGGAAAAAVAIAMAPWLADFDQIFAMFVANAGKALAAQIAVVVLLVAFRRFRRG